MTEFHWQLHIVYYGSVLMPGLLLSLRNINHCLRFKFSTVHKFIVYLVRARVFSFSLIELSLCDYKCCLGHFISQVALAQLQLLCSCHMRDCAIPLLCGKGPYCRLVLRSKFYHALQNLS